MELNMEQGTLKFLHDFSKKKTQQDDVERQWVV